MDLGMSTIDHCLSIHILCKRIKKRKGLNSVTTVTVYLLSMVDLSSTTTQITPLPGPQHTGKLIQKIILATMKNMNMQTYTQVNLIKEFDKKKKN